MNPPRTILFDLDGTLVDTIPFILACARHTFDGYERRLSDAEWLAGIGTPLRTQIAALALRPDDVEPLISRYRAFWLENHDRLTRPFAGAVEVVRGLAKRDHCVGIVTSKTERGALHTLSHVGLLGLVRTVVTADSCPKPKPDPMPVLLALERLGAKPSNALFIGDSHHDISSGKGAGVVTVAALWGACSRDQLLAYEPDHELETITGLPALVEAIDAK